MNYDEFCEYVKESIDSWLAEEGEYDVSIKSLKKNNDTEQKALFITKLGGEEKFSVSPCIYLENAWYRYTEDTSTLFNQVQELYDCYKESMANLPDICREENISNIRNFDNVKEHIVPFIVNKEWNQESLPYVPHHDILDLTVMYRIMLNSDVPTSIVINNFIMKDWGVSQEEIHKAAVSNIESKMKPRCKNIFDVLKDMNGLAEDIIIQDSRPEKYVVNNELGVYGAAVLLDTDYLKSVAEKLDGDYVILPSSIHDIICLK